MRHLSLHDLHLPGLPGLPGRAPRSARTRDAPDRPLVLVVSCGAATQTALATRVEAAGNAVARAASADTPASIARLRPAAVVLDAGRLAGAQALAQVAALRAVAPCPLVVVMAPGDDATGPAILDAGADDVVPSSVAAAELRARLRAHLRARSKR